MTELSYDQGYREGYQDGLADGWKDWTDALKDVLPNTMTLEPLRVATQIKDYIKKINALTSSPYLNEE